MKLVKNKNLWLVCILSMFLVQITNSVYGPAAKLAKLATPIAKSTPKPVIVTPKALAAKTPVAKPIAKLTANSAPPVTITIPSFVIDILLGGTANSRFDNTSTATSDLIYALNRGEQFSGTITSTLPGSLTLQSSSLKVTGAFASQPNQISYKCAGDAGYTNVPLKLGTNVTIVGPKLTPENITITLAYGNSIDKLYLFYKMSAVYLSNNEALVSALNNILTKGSSLSAQVSGDTLSIFTGKVTSTATVPLGSEILLGWHFTKAHVANCWNSNFVILKPFSLYTIRMINGCTNI